MIIYARRNRIGDLYQESNFNKSYFQHAAWPIIGFAMASISLGVTIYGIAKGEGGE